MTSLGPKRLPAYLRDHLQSADSVLDLGCGRNSPLRYVDRPMHRVGIDAFEPAIEESRERGLHDEYVHGKLPDALAQFSDDEFDATMAIDVLEHLTPEDGKDLLAEMQRIARKKVIVFTPNGYIPQEPYRNNPHQVHRSGWTQSDLEVLGFTVVGLNGWKPLRGERAQFAGPSSVAPAVRILSRLSQIVVKKVPSQAFALLAYEDMQTGRAD